MKSSAQMFGVVLVASFVFSACGITYRNKEVNRFIGQNESVLLEQYGQPWKVSYDSMGRKVMTVELRYTDNVQTEGTSWTDSSGVVHLPRPRTVLKVTWSTESLS